MSVGSSSGACELFTRLDTGHRCNRSLEAGLSNSRPTSPLSHGSKSFSVRRTGIRSCTSATNSLGFVIIMVQDFNVSPFALSCHSSHSPAIVSADDPSRAVKYHGCLPPGGAVRVYAKHEFILERRIEHG